ncbi:MAG TPA: hypothetical protein VMW41_05415 [Candidatus Bathyarchaeia archaeon]|nr:hypothetical protein [Candidatus Bathyarchaeia archaeon]
MSQMKKKLAIIALITLTSTFSIWLPFILSLKSFLGFPIPSGGTSNLWANYDGPNYIIVAKTWYQKKLIERNFSLPLPLEYYPAHWPGYPLLIRLVGNLLPFTQAMMVSTLISSLLAATVYFLFLSEFKLSTNPLWLTVVFLFLPARFFITRSVGTPEPLFIGFILASFYFFKKKKYWRAGIFGALAQITKTPAILLFFTYGIYLLQQAFKNKNVKEAVRKTLKEALPLLMIPLAVLLVFIFYRVRTGDFWAYFHSGDNFHLTLLPFQAFNSSRSWLGDIWTEDMIWLYLLAAISVILLLKKGLTDLGIFAALFYTATLFVAHRDISRYSLPLWPIGLIGFDAFIQRKEFKIAFLLILPAIYLYALNFILGNRAPIADWAPYL